MRRQALDHVSKALRYADVLLTLDLLEAFAMDLGNRVVLLLQPFYAARKWDGNFEIFVFGGIIIIRLVVFQRRFHLPNGLDYSICLLCQLIFLTAIN